MAFWGCSAIKNIIIPKSITKIKDYAFAYCYALKNIDLPNSVIESGESVFKDCSMLKNIDIPNSVTNIGQFAFLYCPALENINVAEDNPAYQSVNGILFNKQLTSVIAFPPKNKHTTYTIPNTVTEIEEYAFLHNSSKLTIIPPP